MKLLLEEVKTSWLHCKDLIIKEATLDLVIAFLEDFKSQYTTFHKRIKNSLSNKYKKISFKLVDKFYLFRKEDGELSRLISFIKLNWQKKEKIIFQMKLLDKIINSFIILIQETMITNF